MKTKIKPLQTDEKISFFLKQRSIRRAFLNNQIKNFKRTLSAEWRRNKSILTYSFILQKSIVKLSKKQRKYHYESLNYPKRGLLLRKIEIIYKEFPSDTPLHYWYDVIVRFNFTNSKFCSNISLDKIEFVDEEMKIKEKIAGHSHSFLIVDIESYSTIKNTIQKVKKIVYPYKK